jgi:iron complex transport system ATP-binding protein
MAIKVNNLKFSYGEKETLKGINLHIKNSKLTGILGPNGCGKSTFLKNVSGYLKSNSGEILINNEKKEHLIKEQRLAKIMSLVPQKSSLMSPMSVEDFVLLGRLPHLKSSWSGYSLEDKKIANEALAALGLEHFKKRIALSLSGGEFQRVLLARSLAQNPEILLLDEPTSALDLNHAVELLNKVKQLVIERGMTGIAVLHDLNLAAMFCDELVLMKEGKVLYQGTPAEVLTEEILSEVYNLKSKIIKDENGNPYVMPLI